MFPERKKISVKDLNVGDMVVGMHVEKGGALLTIVAGEIYQKIISKDNTINYYIKGKTYKLPNRDTIAFSGFLDENEIEVIDQSIYNTIIEMYDQSYKLINEGKIGYRDIGENINELRHKSRAELEEKYAVVEIPETNKDVVLIRQSSIDAIRDITEIQNEERRKRRIEAQ
jgi:hypothetical protein